jgi:hypothetical protein
MPTGRLMTEALASGDYRRQARHRCGRRIPTTPRSRPSSPRHPAGERGRRALIRANMDRWRWLQRDLGGQYLLTNVPEFQLRLTVNNRIVRTYRTIVGKPGRPRRRSSPRRSKG